jgi:3-hydroxybutyrate dehydrogenase
MLKGKTALVTGSTSGIGLGIAERLAAEGAHIVLNGLGQPADAERIAADLRQRHRVKVVYDGADMSRPEAVFAMVQKAIAEFTSRRSTIFHRRSGTRSSRST